MKAPKIRSKDKPILVYFRIYAMGDVYEKDFDDWAVHIYYDIEHA